MPDKKKDSSKKSETVVKPLSAEDKQKALKSAIAQIEKSYGAGAVMRLGEAFSYNVDHIPTGSMMLDLALGIGGVP
ncbi:MAG: DNA recombination/repair protein RecA, partial [Oscillospiraceae bacterium]|nr:DNA recombination/repair protein RecA [Oscillospiraceae bacterium]